jgi:hypothetical protein
VHHTDAGADAETGSYADIVMRIALLDSHCLHATSLPITPIFLTLMTDDAANDMVFTQTRRPCFTHMIIVM